MGEGRRHRDLARSVQADEARLEARGNHHGRGVWIDVDIPLRDAVAGGSPGSEDVAGDAKRPAHHCHLAEAAGEGGVRLQGFCQVRERAQGQHRQPGVLLGNS